MIANCELQIANCELRIREDANKQREADHLITRSLDHLITLSPRSPEWEIP